MSFFNKKKDEKQLASQAQIDTATMSADELMAEFDRESNVRIFTGVWQYVIKGLFLLFAVFLFANRFVMIEERARMSLFLGIIISLSFIMYPAYKRQSKKKNFVPWYDWILMIVGGFPFFYFAYNVESIVNKAYNIGTAEEVLALIGIICLFEVCRRAVGLPILFVAGGFIVYAFVYGKSLHSILYNLFYTTSGILGTPLNVCSTFIVFFIILGAFLEKTGIGEFFVDLANSIAGATSGGPAKVAVISSALEGMYSGSSVANTVGSGSVTIPVMKGIGYKPEFAAAVEAAASTGGQIMPPIMGAAAFLMAELTAIPYSTIAVAAILPAILYFTGIFFMIHFEAKKLGLKGLPKESIPNFFKLLVKKGYLFLPIIVLVYLMSNGRTSAQSACFAILTTVLIMLITDIVKLIKRAVEEKKVDIGDLIAVVVPVIFIFVGSVCFGFADENISLISAAVYIVLAHFGKNTKESGTIAVNAIESGVRNTMGVSLACGLAGIIAGVVTLTSLGQTLINVIVPIAKNNIFLALFLTMFSCIVLGMGVPTTANYLIMATITAPILIEMGIPMLAAHMFVFYFGIVADITPPVALAAYAGSAIAKSDPMKTGINATRLAITAFIIPYVFALQPDILIQIHNLDLSSFAAAMGTIVSIGSIVISSVLGIVSVSAGMEGYIFTNAKWYTRILFIAAGICLVTPDKFTDVIGIVLFAVCVVLQFVLSRNEKKKASL